MYAPSAVSSVVMLRRGLAIATVILSLGPRLVGAAESRSVPPQKPRVEIDLAEQRLGYLQNLLCVVDRDATHFAFWMASANAANGVLSAVAGGLSAKRSAVGPSIGAFTGAAFALGGAVVGYSVGRAPFRDVYQDFLLQRRLRRPEDAIVDAEGQWLKKAGKERRMRKLTGWVLTGAGATLLVLSTTALVSNYAVPSRSATGHDRAAFTGATLGLGGLLLTNGVTLLVARGPIESGWQAYTIGRQWLKPGAIAAGIVPLFKGGALALEVRY